MPVSYSLTDLELFEVSLVDDPANPAAQVTLWKSKDGADGGTSAIKLERVKGGDTMSTKELEAKITALDTEVSDLTKRAETAEASATDAVAKAADADKLNADFVKAAGENGLDVTVEDGAVTVTKSAETEYVMVDGERVEKALIPAPVLKQIEAQGARITKMEEERVTTVLKTRAEDTMSHMAGSTDDHIALLKAVDDIEDEEVRKAVTSALETADKAMSGIFKEKGDAHIDEDSPSAKLEKMAKDYASEHSVTFHQAFDEVTKTRDGAKLADAARSKAN